MTTQKANEKPADIRTAVREHYGSLAAKSKVTPESCCGPAPSSKASSSSCCGPAETIITKDQISQIYEVPDAATLPEDVTSLSLGCGDPITLAALQPGQTVLDLGSGGGIDCFLAARRVGETGHVIGVDMTPAMIDKARLNQVKVGLPNVEFRLGEIEHLPVANDTVDVIISNCVINLSPDKSQVFREAFRVLKPGGKLAVSDMVTEGKLPDAIKGSLDAWAGCIAGALDVKEYLAAIRAAGFEEVELAPVYMDKSTIDEAVQEFGLKDQLKDYPQDTLYKAVFSAKIKARKPL